jgi:Tfp pilus assembly protein PilF
MELIPGESLETLLAHANAPLDERHVLAWIIQVCEVLSYLHGQHPPIILRDLKPGNIMILPSGDVRVIDFGIARTYKPGQLSNTENLGTLTYASPEHLGQATQTSARSDIYSLGATLYHLLTNREPSALMTPAPGELRRVNPALSEATEQVVIKSMALDPNRRYQTAAEMAAALRDALRALPPSVARARGTAPAAQPAAQSGVRLGAPVVATSPPRPATPVPNAVAVPSTAPRAVRGRGGVMCPRCGYLNRVGARFCARDGVGLPGAPAVTVPGRRVPVATVPVTTVAGPRSAGGMGAATPANPFQALASTASAELVAQRATEAFRAGRYPVAARQLEQAITQGRATYESHLLLGQTFRRLNRPLDAVAQFERAARLRPTAEALLEQGLAEREAGHAAQAEAALLRARQYAPQDPQIAYQLGLVCFEQGHLAQAEGELEAGLALRAEDPAMLETLGRIRAARHEWEAAGDFFRRAIAVQPDGAGAYLELGQTLMAQRRLKEATQVLEQAVSLAPSSAESHVALGMCYHAQGKRRQAHAAVRQAIQLDPHDAAAQRLLKQM